MAPPRPSLPGAIPGSSLDGFAGSERPDGDLVASQATLSSSLATTNASDGDQPQLAAEINATLPTLPTSARLRTGSPHSRSAGTMELERRAAMQDRKAILRDLDFRIRESERLRSARQMSSPRLVHSRSVSKGTLTNPGSLSSEAGDKLPLETAAGSRQRGLIEGSFFFFFFFFFLLVLFINFRSFVNSSNAAHFERCVRLFVFLVRGQRRAGQIFKFAARVSGGWLPLFPHAGLWCRSRGCQHSLIFGVGDSAGFFFSFFLATTREERGGEGRSTKKCISWCLCT